MVTGDLMNTSLRRSSYKWSVQALTFLLISLLPFGASAQRLLEYRSQVPVIDYAQSANDAFTRLFEAIDAGDVSIAYQGERGYLDELLEALHISPSSQVMVFSQTALKGCLISPETPRAIYFNDEVYVAYVAGTPSLEIASMDAVIGPTFYEIPLEPDADIELRRHTSRCLNCHVDNHLSNGGSPIFTMHSALTNAEGNVYFARDSEFASNSTMPLEQRWGGWYVTGMHGDQLHRGNVFFPSPRTDILDRIADGNRASLEDLFDTSPYLSSYSDIVALLVMQHQVDVQNEIARVNYQVRTIAEREGTLTAEELAEQSEPLLRALFMSGEAPLTDTVEGVSGFTEYFQSLGPFDGYGRSLREFDLQTRVFTYPLSYLIYSEAFDALPEQVLAYISRRADKILSGTDQTQAYAHLSDLDRSSIRAILQETKPGFLD